MNTKYIKTKLICIDDSNLENFKFKLTYGKEYLVKLYTQKVNTDSGMPLRSFRNYYVELIDDKGIPTGIVYRKYRFSTLEEFREKQLNKLGV